MISNRVRSALTTTVLAAAASGFLAGCGVEEEAAEQEVFCVGEDGRVVDPDRCDDDDRAGGGGSSVVFLHTAAPGAYRVGDPVRPGSSLIRAGDTAARTRAGLPATGKVTGSRVIGGIGSGVGRSGTGGG